MINRKDRQPDNLNQFQDNKFQVVFSRIPTVTFFCDQINIPGIRSDKPRQVTMGVNAPLPGSKATYDNLTMRFIVDEDLRSWIEIYNWIHDYATPRGSKYYSRLKDYEHADNEMPQYSQCEILILDNRNFAKYRINFTYVFPMQLSGIQLDSTITDINTIYATASFGYTDFAINYIGKASEEVETIIKP